MKTQENALSGTSIQCHQVASSFVGEMGTCLIDHFLTFELKVDNTGSIS